MANQPEITEEQLEGFRMVRSFQKRLQRVARSRTGHRTWADPRRKTQQAQYLGLFLFGLINPVLRSMRGLCQASRFAKVQECTGAGVCKPATFSEMQHLLDPALLQEVFADVAQELHQRQGSKPGQVSWRIVDSSVFDVVGRMGWAYFQTHRGEPQCAIRLHVSLDLVSAAPVNAQIGTAKTCERKLWKRSWKEGAAEIGDRNYSQDYGLLRLLERKEGLFVVRLREKQVYLSQVEEIPLTEACRLAQVTRHAWANLGKSADKPGPRVRVVWVKTKEGGELMLATNQTVEQMSAAEVSQLYRYRWQIELFFRWIKCILGCRHFLAESPRGVAIQLYLALIAAVLVQLYLGQRPNKRIWEALQLYCMGWITAQELEASLTEELARQQRKIAKKS